MTPIVFNRRIIGTFHIKLKHETCYGTVVDYLAALPVHLDDEPLNVERIPLYGRQLADGGWALEVASLDDFAKIATSEKIVTRVVPAVPAAYAEDAPDD